MNTSLPLSTLLTILAVYFFSCNNKVYFQETSILADQTEEYFRHFTLNELRNASAISISENNGEHLRMQPLTEFGFNEIKSFNLDPVENLLMGNDYERGNEVRYYFSNIDSALSELRQGRKERDGSVIYKILTEELNRLSESQAERKKLIINSDLMEKSFIDFYNQSIFYKVKNSPDQIKKLLLDKYPLKDLSGIDVYIIYKPIDKLDSERFEFVSGFYKSLLESFGAKVFVSGSLNVN